MNSFLICISVPPPQLTLTITPSGTLYEGTPVNLTCTATINTTSVNTNITVYSWWSWSTTGYSYYDRITIVNMLESAPYTSVLMIDPADDMDTGSYHHCYARVLQNSGQPLILSSYYQYATTYLNITGLSFFNIILIMNYCSSP